MPHTRHCRSRGTPSTPARRVRAVRAVHPLVRAGLTVLAAAGQVTVDCPDVDRPSAPRCPCLFPASTETCKTLACSDAVGGGLADAHKCQTFPASTVAGTCTLAALALPPLIVAGALPSRLLLPWRAPQRDRPGGVSDGEQVRGCPPPPPPPRSVRGAGWPSHPQPCVRNILEREGDMCQEWGRVYALARGMILATSAVVVLINSFLEAFLKRARACTKGHRGAAAHARAGARRHGTL